MLIIRAVSIMKALYPNFSYIFLYHRRPIWWQALYLYQGYLHGPEISCCGSSQASPQGHRWKQVCTTVPQTTNKCRSLVTSSRQCHEIFCFRLFPWIIFPQAPENNIRVISIFLNLTPVLTTPAANFATGTAGVVDTGCKFLPSVTKTPVQWQTTGTISDC